MNSNRADGLRLLPAVDSVLNEPPVDALCGEHGRVVVVRWLREILDELRRDFPAQLPATRTEITVRIIARLAQVANRDAAQQLRRVINATGVIVHTNLGRAPLATAAIEAVVEAAQCNNLEVDLSTGRRGRRGAAVESLCRELIGAEAALVVNNCAAATLLALQTLAGGREVVVSRGQLVEIGGSFRLPDVFAQAGARLREVGTTNRTRLDDYERAIGAETAALLRVHPSNYRMTGFCESVSIAELAELAHHHELPALDDVGSGCLYDLSCYGLAGESIVGDSVRAGADLVLFSGDKLLGGPQCGIIAGRAALVEKLRVNPLARALRVDKLTLAALQATLQIHRSGRAFAEIPALRQLTQSVADIEQRAARVIERLAAIELPAHTLSIQAVDSAPGGGALPGLTLASRAIAVSGPHVEQIAERLRLGRPAVFPRLGDGSVLIDLRTVLPEDDEIVAQRLRDCVAN